MPEATRVVRHRRGVPVYDYRTDQVTPPVSVMRFTERTAPGPHIHDFPALLYLQSAGVVYVVAAGEVVEATDMPDLESGIAVFFDPAALGGAGRNPWPAWRAHPLLFPFLHQQSGGVLELTVPAARRPVWESTIAAIEAELAQQQEGYRQAASAHLTLLLIDLARMAADVVGDLRRSGEPLLAEVFDVIDQRHSAPLSLRDVADTVGMTPGHLTTVVRRRTGRTVQAWITERRMAEARRLLADTELSIGEIACRVGILDPGYFTRLFRRNHGLSPRQWRDQPDATARGRAG
ncbi:helix-turn-helix transcriptional regulator [Nocardia sp. NBC_00565]|uniref:helix-turn-helix transcriptional regulator n=1 Tax=Nocardia sp. NBC_00565 TaxID=2975993 RepID=UPI002E81FDA0|nr:helix-turn-helix transcriptional regulator [Nocardia sp. NBC_00565]WUC01037.1 helix-turn-helix transcriptional regulator [Nocardia sp. NBC_00565]